MQHRIEQIWQSGGIIAWILSPLSLLYSIGWISYLLIYRLGFKKAKRFPIPIICIGNLVAGGSGKTPLALAISDILIEAGILVVVSTSGYGSPKSDSANIAPEGQLDVRDWGDESTMLRWLRPELPLIVGRDRVKAAELAAEKFPNSVFLMDDGFQHLPLSKDLTIVVDVEGPNQLCFPAGPYREPRKYGLSRATKIFKLGKDFVARGVILKEPDGTIRTNVAEADTLCAIANPNRFIRSLESAGTIVRNQRVLSDHDPLIRPDLFDNIGEERPLIVTAKDFVKLRIRPDLEGLDLIVADYGVRIDKREEFRSWLVQKLNEIQA